MTNILAKSIGWFMRNCLYHIFAILVTAEAAILDGQFVEKSVITLCEDLCDTILV